MAKTRRSCLVLALVAAGCRRDTAPPLPETVAGSWRRTALREVPAASAPALLARGTVRRAFNASYEGSGRAGVDLYELASPASALDAVQRWRPAPDAVFFYQGRYFAVVKWTGEPDRKSLGAFVRALETALAPVSR